MKKWIAGVVGLILSGTLWGSVILQEDFSYADGTKIESLSGWSDQQGLTDRGVVSNGVVYLNNDSGARFIYSMNDSYAVSSGSDADYTVSELWLRIRVENSFGPIRPGFGSSAYTGTWDQYASVLFGETDGAVSNFRAFSQDGFANPATLPTYNGSGFVDIYGRLSDDNGSLKVEFWFDPSNPQNLALTEADVTKTKAYTDSKTIDQLIISSWSFDGLAIDSYYAGTELVDVIPEPTTLGLFSISGILLGMLRHNISRR